MSKSVPLLKEKGSSYCGKSRCETCFNIKEANTFQSFVTKKIYKISRHFHCDSHSVVFTFYKVCGLQYVGSTVDRFRLRWNNYKCSQRVALEDGTPKQNYFHQHFLSEDYHWLLEDCEITLIDQTDPSDPTTREFSGCMNLKLLRLWDWIFLTLFKTHLFLAFVFQWSSLGVYLRFSTFVMVDLMHSCDCNCNFDTSS